MKVIELYNRLGELLGGGFEDLEVYLEDQEGDNLIKCNLVGFSLEERDKVFLCHSKPEVEE